MADTTERVVSLEKLAKRIEEYNSAKLNSIADKIRTANLEKDQEILLKISYKVDELKSTPSCKQKLCLIELATNLSTT